MHAPSPIPSISYTQNGILNMLDRNRRIKTCPERFQDCYDKFDIIFTCEERVYDQVVEGEGSDSLWQCFFCSFETEITNLSKPINLVNSK